MRTVRATLQKGGNNKYTVVVFPGLNHLFQHCQTGDFSEYAVIDESFATEVLQEMGSWVDKNK